MKFRLFTLFLVLLLLLSGCSLSRKIDAAEDRIEHKLDVVEDSIEDALTVTPTPPQKVYASPTPEQITEADALNIALKHAAVSQEEVQYLYADFEIDDRIPQYEVKFSVGRIEYEYEIHADTGEILSFDRDD